ncbi:TetR/AcrR family transcriptional regulator, partial [Limosilactobacillus sp.]
MSDILFLSLKDLLLTHSFSEITVQNIVDNCEVSRTTFYRCFKDKYELA